MIPQGPEFHRRGPAATGAGDTAAWLAVVFGKDNQVLRQDVTLLSRISVSCVPALSHAAGTGGLAAADAPDGAIRGVIDAMMLRRKSK